MTARSDELVLAVHPTTRGYGWVLFEAAHSPLDWGIVSATAKRKTRLLTRFERILKRHEPAVLVLEEFENAPVRRGQRARELSSAMLHQARCSGIKTFVFPRSMVQAHFATQEATTRYDVAKAVARKIAALSPRLPGERKPWMPEGHTQSLFDAAALALTYFEAKRHLF